MKINYVKTRGFRKFEDTFETNLYDVTNITGKNRSGKSNVLYAIINIILGTNLTGNEKISLINKNCDNSYGELRFTDNNGIEHTIIRGKNKYSNDANFLSLDGKPIKQEDLIGFYKDKKLFLSIINPLYFLNKKTAEQKEMVDKYLSDIEPIEVFNGLGKRQQNQLIEKYYNNEKIPFKELTLEQQAEFVNSKMLDICMDIAYNNLSKDEQILLEGIPKDVPSYITELNGNIKRSENFISILNGKIEYAQNIVNEELPEYKVFNDEEKLQLAKQEIDELKINPKVLDKEAQRKAVESLENDISIKENECNKLNVKMEEGKSKFYAIKNGKVCMCPTCNQNIQDKSKDIALSNMQKELIEYFENKKLLEKEISNLRVKFTIEKCKYNALNGENTDIKTIRLKALEERVRMLENEKVEIQNFNNTIKIKEQNINGAKIDIDKFNAEKQNKIEFINSLTDAKKVAQKLYISYLEEKMKLAKKYLKDVDIQFYSILKTTGEIKEDFVITYKNNPLQDLSRSETIATALEFANMFNKISKANFPIFVDDYESCADYNFIKEYSKDTQIIIAKVIKGNLLKIADANSDECTIITPKTKELKIGDTSENNLNSFAEIQEAA